MNKLKNHFAATFALAILFFAALNGSALGQSGSSKKEDSAEKPVENAENTKTVDARQSGVWTVGINPTQNTVQLSNSAINPLPVKIIESGARKPFQTRASVNIPAGDNFETAFLPIPAGKRLVIENISAIARCPQGQRMELDFFTYFDNGDGAGDALNDVTFHRVALTEQGTFASLGTTVLTANHKVLVFADERIGTSHYQIGVRARINGIAAGTAQGQITFSGYLEDLPSAP
jgi:hypothetical protein